MTTNDVRYDESGKVHFHDSCVTDANQPMFDAEWQRRAFGLAVALSEFDHYSWDDFQGALIRTIDDWEKQGDAARPWEYYDHWVATLDMLVDRHELLTNPVLTDANDHAVAHDHDH